MTSVSIVSGLAARIKYLIMNELTMPSRCSLFLTELESISRLLTATDQETKWSKPFVVLEKEIVRLCYKIGDVTAAIQGGIPSKGKGNLFGGMFSSTSVASEKDLQTLQDELVRLRNSLKSIANETPGSVDRQVLEDELERLLPNYFESPKASMREEMEKQVKNTLLSRHDLSVVSILGKAGIGKTTLAKKLFDNTDVRKHFMCFAWVPVNKECKPIKVFEEILLQLSPETKADISGLKEIELIHKVITIQKQKRCLLVLDDICAAQDWKSIRVASLPTGSSSKILITTRSSEVVKVASSKDGIYSMPPLTQKDCFKILKEKARFNGQELKTVGKIILSLCQDLPLMAVMLGKSLKAMDVASRNQSSRGKGYYRSQNSEGEMQVFGQSYHGILQTVGEIISSLCQCLPSKAVTLGNSLKTIDFTAGIQLLHEISYYKRSVKTVDVAARNQLLREINYYKSQYSEGEMQVLGLCYHRLPDELKASLLYMGQFPEGQNIEVDKLHLLLEAEDLISRDNIFMQPVRKILEELSQRKLIEVQEDKVSMARMYKSCQLQEQVRNFCIFKGLNEELFEIVDFKSGKKLGDCTRRLAVYLSKYKAGDSIPFNSQDMVKNISSLLIFDAYTSQQKSTWPSQINDLKEFSRLRVLGFDGVDFKVRKFPKGIDKVVFLTYLSFRGCWLVEFPSHISNLPCLETLDLRVHADCMVSIPNVLSKMKRLRHLYFPIKYESKSKLQLGGLERLQILVNFDTKVCDVNDLLKLIKNLQVLTTVSQGNDKDLEAIVKYLDEEALHLQQSSLHIKNFDCYITMNRVKILEKLLECKTLQSLHIEGQIDQLPKDHVSISPNFTELIFDGSRIHEDDPMNVLGNLPNLRSLVLTNNAFIGKEMSIALAPNFRNLRSLKVLNLEYLEKLTFKKGAMPMLSTLVVDKCDNLKEVLVPKPLDKKLKRAQRKRRGDVYTVEPLPTII